MADYATVAEIQSKFLGVEFSTETSVTLSDINNWITRKSNMIDARLASRYVLPVDETNEAALDILKEICINLVIFEVEDVMNLGRTEPRTDENGKRLEKSRGEKALERAMRELENLEKGVSTLIGVAVKTADIYNSNVQSSGCYDPVFKKGERQW